VLSLFVLSSGALLRVYPAATCFAPTCPSAHDPPRVQYHCQASARVHPHNLFDPLSRRVIELANLLWVLPAEGQLIQERVHLEEFRELSSVRDLTVEQNVPSTILSSPIQRPTLHRARGPATNGTAGQHDTATTSGLRPHLQEHLEFRKQLCRQRDSRGSSRRGRHRISRPPLWQQKRREQIP